MTSANRPARLNRTLLAVIGLLLLAAGAFGVALGLGLLPGLDPTAALLPARLALPAWAGYAAIAAAVVVGLLCLRWLLAQALRRPRTGTWRLPAAPIEGSERGSTTMAADRAADALAADIESYPGVLSATAALTGPRHRPDLHLDVTAGTDIALADLRERLAGHALPRLRSALDIEGMHARMILRLDTDKTAAPHVH